MQRFLYKGINFSGAEVVGDIQAKNIKEATRILNKELSYITEIGKKGITGNIGEDYSKKKMKNEELSDFLLQIGNMLMAGFSLPTTLVNLARYGEGISRYVAVQMYQDIMESKSVSSSFKRLKYVMGEDFENYINVGQESGALPSVLIQLAGDVKTSGKTLKKIKGALAYPVGLFIVTLIVSYFMFTVIVPKIAEAIFEIVEVELPFLTRVILSISSFLKKYGIFIIITIIISAIIFRFLIKGPMHYKWSKFIATAPLIGDLIQNKELVAFYRAISIGVGAGMSSYQSFDNAAKSVQNEYLHEELTDSVYNLRNESMSIQTTFQDSEYISGIDIQSLEVGHQSGTLGEMALFCAERADARNEKAVDILTKTLEPVMIVIMAALVGTIMYAIYSPIFGMAAGIK